MTPPRILKIRVTAINENVTWLKIGKNLLNHAIDRSTGLNHHHDLSRRFQRRCKSGQRMRSQHLGFDGSISDEFVHDAVEPIENSNLNAFSCHVQCETFPHYTESNQSDITAWFHFVYTLNLINWSGGFNGAGIVDFRVTKSAGLRTVLHCVCTRNAGMPRSEVVAQTVDEAWRATSAQTHFKPADGVRIARASRPCAVRCGRRCRGTPC